MASGSFIISLDFELHWGVRDVVSIAKTRDHFLRAREALPEVLRLFREREVHATWATVGFLFARDKKQLLEHLPDVRPRYSDPQLDPYASLDEVGEDEERDPFHFARSLLNRIAEVPGQQIGSHTFSHYYCLEAGQSIEAFEADLGAAASIGAPFGSVTDAIVFPRGQHNPSYSHALHAAGVKAFRVPPPFVAYRARRAEEQTLLHRGLRLVDSYVPLAGSHAWPPSRSAHAPVQMTAGLFLRPYSPSRRALEPIRLRRLERAMAEAAKTGQDFHLWWHPHNFGTNTGENLAMLEGVLDTYRTLRERHGWPSRTMGEAAEEALA